MRRAPFPLLVAVILVSSSSWAAAAGPRERHTAADMQLAASVLLGRTDLADTWGTYAPRPTGDPLRCSSRLTPEESDLVERGHALSPLFTRGTKQGLVQSARVYASAAQANSAWARRTMKMLVLCAQRRLEDTSTMMSWVSVVGWRPLELPRLVPHVAGYRVIGDASNGKQKAKVYLDVLLLGRDRTLTTVLLTSYDAPLPKLAEDSLVRTISERLNAA